MLTARCGARHQPGATWTSLFLYMQNFFYTLHLCFIGRGSRGPICISSKTTSLAGGEGRCNHQYRRDEVFGVEEAVVACKPLRPPRPCLPSERVSVASSDARGAVRGAFQHPQRSERDAMFHRTGMDLMCAGVMVVNRSVQHYNQEP